MQILQIATAEFVGFLAASCSYAPYIASSADDYNSTIEKTTNDMIVRNVLLGRDAAHLNFTDVAQIRGQMQGTFSAQATFPFGVLNGSTARNSAQGGPVSFQNTPTFDFNPNNAKQFWLGVTNPISPDLFGYFLQR